MEDQILWPVLAFGLLIGTLGWMLYWAGIHVIGAFVGAGAGLALAALVVTSLELQRFSAIVGIVGFLLGAAGGMYLMRVINYYAFFVIGMMLGAPIGSAVPGLAILEGQAWAHTTAALTISTAVVALAGGLLVLLLRRYVIALVAAFLGAMLIAISVPEAHRDLSGVLAFVGSVTVQFGLIRAFLPEERMNLFSVERKPRGA